MASATPGPVGSDIGTARERIAELEAQLERSERRRRANEEWAEFLERELQAKDQRLDSVISHYEELLEEAKDEQEPPAQRGLWSRTVACLTLGMR